MRDVLLYAVSFLLGMAASRWWTYHEQTKALRAAAKQWANARCPECSMPFGQGHMPDCTHPWNVRSGRADYPKET